MTKEWPHRPWRLAWLLSAVALGACAGATAEVSEPVPAATVRAPVSEAHVVEQEAAVAPAVDANLPPGLRKAMVGYRKELTNAAARDEALERLVRRYMHLTREIFRRFRRQHTASGATGSYDPLPSWRFQAQASWMLRDLSARANAVRGQLRHIAQALHLDLKRPGNKASRAGRIAMFDKMMGCISEDASTRAEHGKSYLRTASVLGPRIEPERRNRLLRHELDMMRTTVRCTAMASKRNPPGMP